MTRDQLSSDQLHQLQELRERFRIVGRETDSDDVPTLIFLAIDSLLENQPGDWASGVQVDEVDGLIAFYRHEAAALRRTGIAE